MSFLSFDLMITFSLFSPFVSSSSDQIALKKSDSKQHNLKNTLMFKSPEHQDFFFFSWLASVEEHSPIPTKIALNPSSFKEFRVIPFIPRPFSHTTWFGSQSNHENDITVPEGSGNDQSRLGWGNPPSRMTRLQRMPSGQHF